MAAYEDALERLESLLVCKILIGKDAEALRLVLDQVRGGSEIPLISPAEAAILEATGWRVHLEDDLTGDSGVAECPDCDGSGDDEPPCTDCGGTGISYQTERRCACTLTEEEQRAWQETREGMNR